MFHFKIHSDQIWIKISLEESTTFQGEIIDRYETFGLVDFEINWSVKNMSTNERKTCFGKWDRYWEKIFNIDIYSKNWNLSVGTDISEEE
jgi:hypothetical protein